MGPPIGLNEINFPPPSIGDITLSGPDFHGFCSVPLRFEIVSWFLIVSGWFPFFLKVVYWFRE